jgi:GNAT superfamily N-acetyltransferase
MDGDRVVGFAQAISDGELFAFIPLIEVKAEYQGRGIGSELLNRLMTRLEGHYGIDLLCDPGLKPFYEKAGMTEVSGMCIRNFSALADN